MKDPLIFDEEQRDQLRIEMIFLRMCLLPHLSITISTLLFVRCHTTHQFFPRPFQRMSILIGEKLNEIFKNKQNQNQEAAYIALRQLNNTDLSHYLAQFEKRITNPYFVNI
jgi:hypothetical protein